MKKLAALILIALALFVACPAPRPTHIVKVCEATGLLPNQYCPVVVERRFYVGAEPTTVCTLHKAPEPPYPPVADQSLPRVGVDVYQLIVFPIDQIKQYMDDLVKNGGSVLRVFMVYTWPEGIETAGWKFSPFLQVGWYTEQSGAYAGQTFPVFDLMRWNDEAWAKWRAVFAMCRERGIRLTVSVFDGCSTGAKADRFNPFIMCHQHFGTEEMPVYQDFNGKDVTGNGEHTGGYFGGFKEDAGGTMPQYFKSLLVKTVLELTASGVDYRIGTNEVQCPLVPDHDQAYSDAVLYDWLDFWINTLTAEGVKAERIVLSIAGTHDRQRVTVPLGQKYGVIEQMHGPNSPETLNKFLTLFPGVEMDGDGMDPKAEGYTNDFGYAMPSIIQCQSIRKVLTDRGIKEYHIFNGYMESPGWQDLTKAEWSEQRALAGK